MDTESVLLMVTLIDLLDSTIKGKVRISVLALATKVCAFTILISLLVIVIVGVLPVLLVTLKDLIIKVSTAPAPAAEGVNRVVASVVVKVVP